MKIPIKRKKCFYGLLALAMGMLVACGETETDDDEIVEESALEERSLEDNSSEDNSSEDSGSDDDSFPGEIRLDNNYVPRTEITDDYIAVFHGGSGELTYQTYIYAVDLGVGNYGYEYINSELYGMSAASLKEKIVEVGCVAWSDDVFAKAKEFGAYSYVTIPGDSEIYSIDEFSGMFLTN